MTPLLSLAGSPVIRVMRTRMTMQLSQWGGRENAKNLERVDQSLGFGACGVMSWIDGWKSGVWHVACGGSLENSPIHPPILENQAEFCPWQLQAPWQARCGFYHQWWVGIIHDYWLVSHPHHHHMVVSLIWLNDPNSCSMDVHFNMAVSQWWAWITLNTAKKVNKA